MSDQNLRSKLIRLAHAKPELRPHLLPMLVKGRSKQASSLTGLINDWIKGCCSKAMATLAKDAKLSQPSSVTPTFLKYKSSDLTFHFSWEIQGSDFKLEVEVQAGNNQPSESDVIDFDFGDSQESVVADIIKNVKPLLPSP